MDLIYSIRLVCSLERTKLFEIVSKYITYFSIILFPFSLITTNKIELILFNSIIFVVSIILVSSPKILGIVHSYVDPIFKPMNDLFITLQLNISMLDKGIIIDNYTFRFLRSDNIATDIKLLTDLGHEAFKGYSKYSYEDRKGFYNRWYKRNRKVFVLIFDAHGVAIGYFCLLPMKQYHANNHFRGTKSQFTLDSEDICETDEKTNLVYLQGVYVIEKMRANFRLTIAIYQIFCSLIKNWMLNENELTLYAEQFSPNGESILKKLGFYTNRVSANNFSIYELHFSGDRGNKPEMDKNYENYQKLKADILSSTQGY